VDGSKIGTPASMEVDMVIGADGANSRVAKEIDAGEYDYAIAFQERIRIPGEYYGQVVFGCGGFGPMV
jgi:geranylgeranyl reductase